MNYDEANAQLTGRCKDRRKLANNTYLERRGEDIAVKYHNTDVVTFRPNEDIVLDSGGWLTYTTKERMTWYLDGGWVRQENGVWYVKWHGAEYRYADGMVLHADGSVSGSPDDDQAAKLDRINATKRKHIRKFVNSITPEKVVYAWEHPDGDCLLCRVGDTEHLLEHVTAGYFHAHLAYNAVKDRNYGDPTFIMQMIYGEAQRDQVSGFLTKDLARYLRKHILEGVATR